MNMVRTYFEEQKAGLLKKEKETRQELEILDSAMIEVLFSDIPDGEKVKLAKFVNGAKERDKSRLKALEERKAFLSRLLEVTGDH